MVKVLIQKEVFFLQDLMNFLNGLILCNTQSSATFFVNRLLPDILTESFSFAQKKEKCAMTLPSLEF